MKTEIKRVLAIVLPLFFLSVLLSCAFISLVNDIYAFVKPDEVIAFSIAENSTLDDISYRLAEKGVIRNPFVFSAYVNLKEKTNSVENFCGEITLNSNMSYREILFYFVN